MRTNILGRIALRILAVLLTFTFVACGGGDDDPVVPAEDTTITASAEDVAAPAEDTDTASPECTNGDWMQNTSCSGQDMCENLGIHMSGPDESVGEPPFAGTIFINRDILTDADPSAFKGLTHTGQGIRSMFDRRIGSWADYNAHLFDAVFGSDMHIEIQVNPEFSQNEAKVEAEKYAFSIGQLPAFLMTDVETVWIHKGVEGFGGGNNNLLIHTGQGEQYIEEGILEETFIHEATHTSFDGTHSADEHWLMAQNADGVAISQYAQDNPDREDLAETVLLYLALRFWPDRIPKSLQDTVMETVPNRLRYLNCQNITVDIVE